MIYSDRQMKALEYVGLSEGKEFTNDPDDDGGPTKFGLTEKLAKRYGVKNIATVTLKEVQRIFILEFWNPNFSRMENDRLVIKVFDFAIHAGMTKAIMVLQLCLVDFGLGIQVDGKLGPLTVRASNAVREDELLKRFADRQEGYYRHRAKVKPTNEKYVVARDGGDGGWITRAKRIPV